MGKKVKIKCTNCGGTGSVAAGWLCEHCGGSGKQEAELAED